MKDLEEKRLDLVKVLIEVSSLLAVVITFLFQILASEPYKIYQSLVVIYGFGITFSIFIIGAVAYYFFIMLKVKNKHVIRLFSLYTSLGFSLLFSILLQISIGIYYASLAYFIAFSLLLYLGLTSNLQLKLNKKINSRKK